jgi:outer membrane protein TolC
MNKIKIFIIGMFTVILTAFPALAEELTINNGDTLTLQGCIDIAVKKNPNITLGNNINKIYESRIGQAKSTYFPQLNLSSGYSRQNPTTNSALDNSISQYAGSVGVNQLLFDFGKTPTKVKIQNLNLDSSKFDVDNTVVQVAYNVKQAYFNALSAKISKDIYNQSIKQYEKHLEQANAFFKTGIRSKIDVTTAEVNLSNVKLDYIKANNIYKTSISNLNNAMGLPEAPEYDIEDTFTFNHIDNNAENEVDISYQHNKKLEKPEKKSVLKSKISKQNIIDNLNFKKYDISFEDAIKTAYNSRPDLKSLAVKENAAKESIKLVKKDYLPSLSGFTNYGIGGQQFPLDNGWSVGANVNVPIFNGFLTKSQINEAKANLDIAKSDVEILRQNIYLQVQQAYINLIEAEKRIPVTSLIVKQAQEKLDLANGRYTVGVGNSIEVQDAEISYDNAQLSFVQALYDYNIARSNLEKAMGVK